MNAVPKSLWLEALRSGRFKQGRGALKNSEGEHCILGVACEVFNDLHPNDRLSEKIWGRKNKTTFDGHSESLPDRVSDWLGTGYPAHDPVAKTDSRRTVVWVPENLSLSQLNDQFFTFHQIADVIEHLL